MGDLTSTSIFELLAALFLYASAFYLWFNADELADADEGSRKVTAPQWKQAALAGIAGAIVFSVMFVDSAGLLG